MQHKAMLKQRLKRKKSNDTGQENTLPKQRESYIVDLYILSESDFIRSNNPATFDWQQPK